MPAASGRLAAIATVGGTQSDPRAQAGVTLTGGRYGGAALDAAASGSYGAGHARIDDARVAYGGTTGTASGDLTGLTTRTPRVDVAAQVRGADAAALSHQFHLPLRYPDGGIDADVHVSGAASDPSVAGSARIAAGSINGLAFHDAVVPLSGNARALDVRGGRATVGSTTLRFDGCRLAARRARRAALETGSTWPTSTTTSTPATRWPGAAGWRWTSASTAARWRRRATSRWPTRATAGCRSATSTRAGRRTAAPSPATHASADRTAGWSPAARRSFRRAIR